jgi:hypothetical protein
MLDGLYCELQSVYVTIGEISRPSHHGPWLNTLSWFH